MIRIKDLFNVVKAKSNSFSDYSLGDVPFITNGYYENGFVGFVEPCDSDRVFEEIGICVSAFCEATVQIPPFLPRGNGGSGLCVLKPIKKMSYDELVNYASIINTSIKWRYSYGRMVNKKRLEKELIPEIQVIKMDFKEKINVYIPKNETFKLFNEQIELKDFLVTKLFTLQHGDFHSLQDLDEGKSPTVSRLNTNNGIMGYYEKPSEAKIYMPMTITISTVTGDAFVQLDEYIATDNVVICEPINPLFPETLFFIVMMLNRDKWRWMYGRQCYKTKFSKTVIKLPADENGILDEEIIHKFVRSHYGWKSIERYITKNQISCKSSNIVP